MKKKQKTENTRKITSRRKGEKICKATEQATEAKLVRISQNYFQTKFKVIKNCKQYWNNFRKCAFCKKKKKKKKKKISRQWNQNAETDKHFLEINNCMTNDEQQ